MIYHSERLVGVNPVLVGFIESLIDCLTKHYPDWLILCGWRGRIDQHAAFLTKTSMVDWPHSKHNHMINGLPDSLAVDLSPYPYDGGKDKSRLYLVAGYAMAVANELGVKLRIGADWDGDFQTLDQQLQDPWHYELIV